MFMIASFLVVQLSLRQAQGRVHLVSSTQLVKGSDALFLPLCFRDPECLLVLHNVCQDSTAQEHHVLSPGWVFDSDFEVLMTVSMERLRVGESRLTFNLDPSPPRTRVKYSCFISFSNLDGNPGYIDDPPERTICLYSSDRVSTAACWMVWNRSSGRHVSTP